MINLKPYNAVKGLIFYHNKILVLEPLEFVGGKYEVPGGRMNCGEDYKSALEREVREETGLDIKIVRLLNRWSVDLPHKSIHLDGRTYLCEASTEMVKLSGEHKSYKWASKEELRGLDFPDWLKEAINNI